VERRAKAKGIKLHQRTIGRIYNGDGANLESVELLAKLYGLDVWQLLVENFDPSHPPSLYCMTDQERDFYAKLKSAADALAIINPSLK
jgi:hypothetical protein